MKASEQYFPVVLFIIFYKVILTFKSVDEIPKCDHSNEMYLAILSLRFCKGTINLFALISRKRGRISKL